MFVDRSAQIEVNMFPNILKHVARNVSKFPKHVGVAFFRDAVMFATVLKVKTRR